jgi:hypothetical protein
MWLAFPLIFALVFALIGGVLLGGVFTLVLVPLVIVIAVSAFGYAIWARAAGAAGSKEQPGTAGEPLPHSSHQNAPAAPATPDELVDARQKQ